MRARRALIAGSIGNFIEWYEFSVYGFFATIIAATFFGGGGGVEALIKTYASFALAFFFRPVGAAIFGRAGDRIGRKPTLIIVVLVMSFATALIGVLPGYSTLGAAAPVLLTGVRIVQGLSAGGEFGGAVSVITEFAPDSRRGLYGAWQSFTVALGLLAGAGVAAVLSAALSPSELASWGWRIPFLLALPMGLVALWLRIRLEETPAFRRVDRAEDPAVDHAVDRAGDPDAIGAPGPRRPAVGETAKAIALGIARLMGWSAAGYTFLVVLPAYLQTSIGATFRQALVATVLANLGFAVTILPAGAISDRFGRRVVTVTGALAIVVLALPLINLLQDKNVSVVAQGIGVFLAGAAVGLIAGPGPALLSEMFPTTVRYTGLGLAYSLSNAVFSGSAGLIITALIAATANKDIPAYYVMITSAISALALATLRRRDQQRSLS